jgi:hypothetical protein
MGGSKYMPLKLSFEKFQRARSYLMNFGRDLEQILFKFHFEDGSRDDLIAKLKKYQGEDGGFRNMGEGHSIHTNMMDTVMAFQYLSEVGCKSDKEIVQKGIRYIIESFNHDYKGWQRRPDETDIQWQDNPCAEVVGYLYEHRQLVPETFLQTVTEIAMTSMSSIKNAREPQFYFLSALCILRMSIRMDESYKSLILDQLKKDIYEIIETDSEKWTTTYCAKPFFFAHSPNSPLFETIKDHVVKSLENEINTQSDEGNFILNWPTKGEDARVWKSIWTLDVLRTLKYHEMIEY